MRSYKVKGETHHVYDLESELPEDISPIKNWRDGYPGDWVLADDNAYIQVLERKKIGKGEIIRTCIGTYKVNQTMDTSERESRYTINGKTGYNTLKERKKPTDKEIKFARKVLKGKDAVRAYMEVYDANSKNYAKRRAALLLKTERIERLMNPSTEELSRVFQDKDITLELLIERAKTEALDSKNGSDRLNALKMLWDAFGVVDKKKVTEVVGMFQGFEPKQIEEVKRPLIEQQTHGDEPI